MSMRIGISGRRSVFSARRRDRKETVDACAEVLRHGGIIRLAVVIAVMAAVLTVLIAPSIAMPETVVREPHVASHSMASSCAGTLTIAELISIVQVFKDDTVQALEHFRIPDYAHGHASLVLRC